MMGWLVAYDISAPKRWRKVYKLVGRAGYRLQYSLFWLPGGHAVGHDLAAALEGVIDRGEDDVRLYPFGSNAWARLYGRPPWSEGVHDALYERFHHCWRACPDQD